MAISPTTVSTIGAAGSITGSLLQAFGAVQQGKSAAIAGETAQQAAEFNALMLEFSAREALRQGGQAKAISQRQAAEERRQGRIATSRALAVASASGAGVSDPTIVNLISRGEGEAHFRASVALYEGEEEMRRLRFDALMGRGAATQSRLAGAAANLAGQNAQSQFNLVAAGKVVEGSASLFSKYARGGPRGDSALIGQQFLDSGFPPNT